MQTNEEKKRTDPAQQSLVTVCREIEPNESFKIAFLPFFTLTVHLPCIPPGAMSCRVPRLGFRIESTKIKVPVFDHWHRRFYRLLMTEKHTFNEMAEGRTMNFSDQDMVSEGKSNYTLSFWCWNYTLVWFKMDEHHHSTSYVIESSISIIILCVVPAWIAFDNDCFSLQCTILID